MLPSGLFAELSFRGWHWWIGLLLGLAAVIAVGVLYVRESARIGFFPRSTMALLRFAIVVTVAFLLLRPVWVKEKKGERRRPIALLVDVSQSMTSKDPRPGITDQWRVAIAYDFVPPD